MMTGPAISTTTNSSNGSATTTTTPTSTTATIGSDYKPWAHLKNSSGGSGGGSGGGGVGIPRTSSGIKIKKLSDRIKEGREKEREKEKERDQGAGAGAGEETVVTTTADDVEFSKTGGIALFDDIA